MSTHYERLGGSEVIRSLVDRFYDLMDADPDYYAIRKLHPEDLTESRNKLAWFLNGWTGGPPDYIDRFGPPFLRRRHLPFAIGVRERDQWMACMTQAMNSVGVEPGLRQALTAALFKTADFMRNQPD
ncbi:MAG: hemoglobin-like protein [Hydrogenophilales bacterium 16-64-46]|nr:MAG: hemoglobin-like protein [Hydrogenophilales bacterium 12-64-13]OYZ05603.1 MAG: hemoglobin-like protein [Hydrogenophilales bacterium 16-64-46]OZA40182.1 MAG: hemoglobin-like protein [Hydrogenophilales bacterium 17-64-34]HQT00463.1 group II truncated hemoglobin [Thiobacillus sp.]